jgi:hypothetical protein
MPQDVLTKVFDKPEVIKPINVVCITQIDQKNEWKQTNKDADNLLAPYSRSHNAIPDTSHNMPERIHLCGPNPWAFKASESADYNQEVGPSKKGWVQGAHPAAAA